MRFRSVCQLSMLHDIANLAVFAAVEELRNYCVTRTHGNVEEHILVWLFITVDSWIDATYCRLVLNYDLNSYNFDSQKHWWYAIPSSLTQHLFENRVSIFRSACNLTIKPIWDWRKIDTRWYASLYWYINFALVRILALGVGMLLMR